MSRFKDLYEGAPHYLQAIPRGISLGFSKYPQAALAAAALQLSGDQRPFSELYNLAQQAGVETTKKSQEEHPVANLLGELTGAAALPWKNPLTGVAPTTVKGSAALGAGYGALSGIGHNTQEGEGILSGLYGAVPGAAFGAGAQYLQNTPLAQKIGSGISEGFKKLKPSVMQSTKGNPNVSSNVTDDVGQQVTGSVAEGQDLSKKFGVPLTRGEHTQIPEHLLNEEMAARGWEGIPQMEAVKKFQENQTANFREAVNEKVQNALANITNKAGSEAEQGFVSKGTHAREAVKEITEAAKTEKKAVGQAYKEAGKEEAVFDIGAVRKFPEHAEDVLQRIEDVTESTAPETFSHIKSFTKLFNKKFPEEVGEITGADLKAMEGWRKGVSEARGYHDLRPSDKRGLGKLTKVYDDYVDDLVESALQSGDPKALDALKEARGIAARYYKKYGAGKKGDIGQNYIDNLVTRAENKVPVTDEQIVNEIFGASEIGFGPQAGAISKTLKSRLSTPAFNQLKLDALERILTPLKAERPSGVTYLKNLARLKKQNPTFMKTFFSGKDLTELNDIGKLAHRIYHRPINRMNPSGTGEFMGRINKLISSIPAVGQGYEVVKTLVNVANRQKTSFNPKHIESQIKYREKPLSIFKKAAVLGGIGESNKQ